jgi:hypothetical protein
MNYYRNYSRYILPYLKNNTNRIVYLDESGINLRSTKNYAWYHKNDYNKIIKKNKNVRINLFLAMRNNNIVCKTYENEHLNQNHFLNFILDC